MDTHTLGIIAAGLLLYSLVSGRLQNTIITAPLVFIAFGAAISVGSLVQIDAESAVIHAITEVTLILVLFSDASRIDLRCVKRDHDLPQRLLMIGMPLTIACGALLALQLFPDFSLWEAALLGALLAPTDAALGQSVVSSRAVPVRIRQAINIESGLNDGIALPAVLLFATLAAGTSDVSGAQAAGGDWLHFVVLQLLLGPFVGLTLGAAGAVATNRMTERGWMGEGFLGISILALALLLYVVAELVGGNGFIAVFLGGMVYGHLLQRQCSFLFEFMETEGQLLMLLTFLVFGVALLPEALQQAEPVHYAYALLSLTVVRILPVLVSMLGTQLRIPTQLFLGWFGPRGLASVLFLLLVLEEFQLESSEAIFTTTAITIALSALLHGISAAPLARWFARFTARYEQAHEHRPATELPLRHGHLRENGTVRP